MTPDELATEVARLAAEVALLRREHQAADEMIRRLDAAAKLILESHGKTALAVLELFEDVARLKSATGLNQL